MTVRHYIKGMSYSIGFLTVGAVLVIAAAWRLYAGRACIAQSATQAASTTERTSVFVAVGILIFGALVFIAGGIHVLGR